MAKSKHDVAVQREVDRILNMFRCVKRAVDTLTDQAGIEQGGLHFFGFDGNNEGSQFRCYVRMYGRSRRVDIFDSSDHGNSHWPMMARYRAMLVAWSATRDPEKLS